MTIDRDPAHLHPLMREAVHQLLQACERAGYSFRLFEGYRSPARQAALYAQGRTEPGRIVTYAAPLCSMHQYGLAADIVGWVDGRWTWDLPPAAWIHMQAFAKTYGLRTLSFEKPHVEWPTSLAECQAGHLPPGGDETWRQCVQPLVRMPELPAKPEGLSEADALNQAQLDRI